MVIQNVGLFFWVDNVFTVCSKNRNSRLIFPFCFDVTPKTFGNLWIAVSSNSAIVELVKVKELVDIILMGSFQFFVNCFA